MRPAQPAHRKSGVGVSRAASLTGRSTAADVLASDLTTRRPYCPGSTQVYEPIRGPANPAPRNYGHARSAGIFGTERNDGLNPLEAIELPEITDPRLQLLHDLWQTRRNGAPAPRQADLDVFD